MIQKIARKRPQQPDDSFHEGRLAGTVGAHDRRQQPSFRHALQVMDGGMAAVAEGEIAKGKAGIGQGTAFGKTERTQSIDDAIYSVTLVIDFCYVITFSPMIKRIKTGAGLLSRNQKLVLSVVIASPVPLSAYAILKALQEEGVRHPLPVYRALHKLVVLGLVHRLHNAFC